MIIVLRSGAAQALVDAVLARIEAAGLPFHVFRGAERVVIAILADPPNDELREALELMPGVEEVSRTQRAYRLASREVRPAGSQVRLGELAVGRDFVVAAGAARLHPLDELVALVRGAEAQGANLFWLGRPIGAELALVLPLIAAVRSQTTLPLLVETWGPDEIDPLYTYCDGLIVGADNLLSYPLIRALSRIKRPIVLCRGAATSVEEWLMVAERVLQGGNFDVILCEQGIRTFETAVRSTLDFSAVAVVKRLSHLPIVANPSLATGRREVVPAMALGVAGAGADGVLIDVHQGAADESTSGPQSLGLTEFWALSRQIRALVSAMQAAGGEAG